MNTPLEEKKVKNKILKNEKKINIKLLDGLIIISTNYELATIHLEPPITKDRIFLSILPMTKDVMNDFKKRWNIS